MLDLKMKKSKTPPNQEMNLESPNPFPSTESPVSDQSLNTSSPPIDTPDHFDTLIDGAEQAERVEAHQAATSTMLQKDDFRILFVRGFGAVSMLTKREAFRLPNEHVSADLANECADAVYGTIRDIPALHFLLHPGNKWMERAFIVSMFSLGMVRAVEAERGKAAPPADFSKAKASVDREDGMPDDAQRAALVGV